METRIIETDTKGLAKLIEFLASEKNKRHIDADISSDNEVFYLESVVGKPNGAINIGISYLVRVGVALRTDKKYTRSLSNVLDEISI